MPENEKVLVPQPPANSYQCQCGLRKDYCRLGQYDTRVRLGPKTTNEDISEPEVLLKVNVLGALSAGAGR